MDQELPIPVPAADRADDRFFRDPATGLKEAEEGLQGALGRLGVRNNPTFADICAADFELWLEQGNEPAPSGGKAKRRCENFRQRNKAEVADDQICRTGEVGHGKIPHVQPLMQDNPAVCDQRGMQLPMADIDTGHMPCTGAQQHIREPARGGTQVETGPSDRADRKMFKRMRQFEPASGDKRMGRDRFNQGRARNPLGRTLPSALTRPAAMAAWALARLSKWPRTTSIRSARSVSGRKGSDISIRSS